ncbi:MAG: LPS assembly lipoprotein LptE [Candidatus Methylacidiphilales bacterium]|nr:LPS assembly lipoprotein LptE [Candidatus Methylacidiphilales bacterium]
MKRPTTTFGIWIASVVLIPLLTLSGCSGYRLGNVPYKEMEGVRSIYVPTVKNKTLEPSLQIAATNAILRAIDNDGTYHSARSSAADATLEVTLSQFSRKPIRSNRENLTTTIQYRLTIVATGTLTNHRTGQKVFSELTATGETDFFVQDDLQESERQAAPTALDQMAQRLVNQITEGW